MDYRQLTGPQLRAIDRQMAAVLFDHIYTDYQQWLDAPNRANCAFVDGEGDVYRKDRVWRPTEYANDWYRAEHLMAQVTGGVQRKVYVAALARLARPGYKPREWYRTLDSGLVFDMLVAPLHLRCLAFLVAVGKLSWDGQNAEEIAAAIPV